MDQSSFSLSKLLVMLRPAFRDMLFSLLEVTEISEPALLWVSIEDRATLDMSPDRCRWNDDPRWLLLQPFSLALADLVKLM
jgi:hypothetical protein